ncbi:MAG: T9SS type A sorting domain-containing protein [Acidobacteriota bacterium]
MKRYFLFFLILMLALAYKISTAQTTSYAGNLVKISMLAKTASLSDTLGRWVDYSYYSPQAIHVNRTYYNGHITLAERSYLIKQNTGYRGYFIEEYWGQNYIETEGQNLSRPFSITGTGWDVIPPYFIETTEVTPLSCGSWLINGSLGNAFIDNNDSLHIFKGIVGREYSQAMEENLVSILGPVGSRYLAAFMTEEKDPWKYEYRLVDLSNSPFIGEYSRPINFEGDPNLYKRAVIFEKLRKIRDDLYIVQSEEDRVRFYKFADTSFNFIKYQPGGPGDEIFSGKNAKWDFRNNRLYKFSGRELISYDFNLSDTTLINRRVLIALDSYGDSIGVDWNFRYAALLTRDSLKIYDIDKEHFINSICIAGINRPVRPVVDSPYVYLHQTTFEENSSIVNVEKENSSVVKSYSLSAYPNPFNPVTTLEFNMPFAGHVELKIYDALGKEVAILVNEVKKEGSYKVQFNASQLPSGIYLCRMNAGKYSETKKIVLLK